MNSDIETTYRNYQACTFIELIPKTHSQVYTEMLLHTDALHTNAFTHRRFYTQTLLHTDSFTHRHFYTQICTQTLLHTDAFTHRRFYKQTLLHTNAFAHRRFYTKTLLHTNAFTYRRFYTQSLEHTLLYTQTLTCVPSKLQFLSIFVSAFDDRPSFLAKELCRQFYSNF